MKNITLSVLILLASSCGKDCMDSTNPQCSNYNPCTAKDLYQTTASFKIYDRLLGQPPIGWEWQDTDTVSIGASFVADIPPKADGSITYEWHIGAGVYHTFRVDFSDGMPQGQNLSATLIVRNSKINKTCFPNDDGADSVTRHYYTATSYKRMTGVYRGAYTSRPYDSIDFRMDFDSNRISLPNKSCRNFYGFDRLNDGTASILITSYGHQYNDSSLECKFDSRCAFNLSKNSKTFSMKYLNRPNSPDTIMYGRKIKSI